MEENNNNKVEKEDLIDGYLVTIDLAYIPNGWSLEDVLTLIKNKSVAVIDSNKVSKCGDHPYGCPIELRRLEPSLIKRESLDIEKQTVIEGLFN